LPHFQESPSITPSWLDAFCRGKELQHLIDRGATHNFIDATIVNRRHIPVKYFEGFNVVVVDEYNMTCTQRIRGLDVTMGNYTLTDDFYVVDLADTHVVLGVQWLYSLGDIHMNYQDMRMKFKENEG
jgi:hypothetical protein